MFECVEVSIIRRARALRLHNERHQQAP
jgi:hypothetical protein